MIIHYCNLTNYLEFLSKLVPTAKNSTMKVTCAKRDLLVKIAGSLVKAPVELNGTPEFQSQMDNNGEAITGSLTIAFALLQAQQSPLLGENDLEKAQIHQYASEAISGLKRSIANDTTKALSELNRELAPKTFMASNYFSIADIAMYSTLSSVSFKPTDPIEIPNVIRYYDMVQRMTQKLATSIELDIQDFDLNIPFIPVIPTAKSSEPKAKVNKDAKPLEAKENASNMMKKSVEDTVDPSKLDLKVGRVLSVTKHPEADSLYVEEIDVGEESPRNVVSGLVKHISIEGPIK